MTILLRQKPLPQVVRQIVQRDNCAWFDPEDMSTMYQDSTGTIPVTAVEQPVGLMLDKSRGMMLGPELVSNGDFSSGTAGWSTYAATLSNISGGLGITPTVVSGNAAWGYVGVPTEAGKLYTITARQVSATSITYIRACNNAELPWINLVSGSYTAGAVGVKKISFKATNTTTYIMLGIDSGSTSNNVVWDDVSVRELYGYHATQSITASRPTLSARYNLLTKTEDFSAVSWSKEFSGTGAIPLITPNYATAPDGTMTATRIVYALNGGTTSADYSRVYQTVTLSANTQTSLGVWVKSANGQIKDISISMTGSDPKLVSVGVDWVFVSNNMIRSDANYLLRFELRGIYRGSDSADILIWHPDLRIGTTPGPYQRVNTATDYNTDERYFPKYLRFDGIDDYLNLPYMGLYANGSASMVMARDTIIPSSQQNYLTEASSTSTPPLYYLDFQVSGQLNQGFFIRNDANTQVALLSNNNGESVSTVSVKTMVDNGNNVKKYRNGTLLNSDNYVRSGTLALSNTLIGAIGYGTPVNFAKMNLYGLILTKSALTDSQRVACERFEARKSGVLM